MSGETWHGGQAGLSAPSLSWPLAEGPHTATKMRSHAGQKQFLPTAALHLGPLRLSLTGTLGGRFSLPRFFDPGVKSHQLKAAFWLLLESLSGSEEAQTPSPPLRPPRPPGLQQPLTPEWARHPQRLFPVAAATRLVRVPT